MHDQEPMEERQTLGQQRVRIEFNPSGTDRVTSIKVMTAELIDLCETMKGKGKDGRLCSLAQTAYEEAAMWAVKAATS